MRILTTLLATAALLAVAAPAARAGSATSPVPLAGRAQPVQYQAAPDADERDDRDERAEWDRRRQWREMRRQRDEERIAEAARQEAQRIEAEREQRRAWRRARGYQPEQPYRYGAPAYDGGAVTYDRK